MLSFLVNEIHDPGIRLVEDHQLLKSVLCIESLFDSAIAVTGAINDFRLSDESVLRDARRVKMDDDFQHHLRGVLGEGCGAEQKNGNEEEITHCGGSFACCGWCAERERLIAAERNCCWPLAFRL